MNSQPPAGLAAGVTGMATGVAPGMPGLPGMAPGLAPGLPGMPMMGLMQPAALLSPGQASGAVPGMLPAGPVPPAPQGAPGSMPVGQMQAGQMQAMLMQQQMFALMQQQQALQRGLPAGLPQSAGAAFTLQAAQAYDQSKQEAIDSEVQELAHTFKLDERITKDLDVQMKKRKETFDDDLKALWEILDGARNPAGLLRVKIREMEEGSFRGVSTPDKDIEEMAKKFNLDNQAQAKLAEVLGKREDKKKDIKQLTKHLQLSNKPSSLVMLMLKDLRAGLPVRDPEYPAAVGSYAHKRGLKRGGKSRSRSRSRRRRRDSSSSSSPPRGTVSRSSGAGPKPDQVVPRDGPARPMTLLERFG